MNKYLLACLLLQSAALAHAATPASAAPLFGADRYAKRCQSQAPHREGHTQGTMLWGTKRDWDTEKRTDENTSVLVSANLESLRLAARKVKGLRLKEGRLVAVPAGVGRASAPAMQSVVGTVLKGTASDGKPVEVAICAAEPSEDPQVVWYRIEAWNSLAQEWENPCVALGDVPDPRALAVGGVWDAAGAHQDTPGKFTFACENGAITKCIGWGYKPWESRDGQPLADVHQACTRMARADYCGNGRSHTHEGTDIDMYDRFNVLARTLEASEDYDPSRGSFEAAWAPDGAVCLGRTRDGRAMETILQECPGRFSPGAGTDLGEGDRCAVERADMNPKNALLRNQSYVPKASTP